MRHHAMSSRIAFSVAALLCLEASPAFAQVGIGDRVRLSSGVIELAEGVLVGQDSSRYLLLPAGSTDTVSIRRDDVYRVERFVKRELYGADAVARGAGLGAGIGAVIAGLGLANASGSERGAEAAGSVALGLASAAIGFIIGSMAAVIPHDVWETVFVR